MNCVKPNDRGASIYSRWAARWCCSLLKKGVLEIVYCMKRREILTIDKATGHATTINKYVLAELSDRLWKMGSLSEIQKKVSPELFNLHICINMIGNWQSDGWWFLISDQAELVPFIPHTLDVLALYELKAAVEHTISLFPSFTVFSNKDKTYYDIIKFLQNARFKVADERLNAISVEDRKTLVHSIHQSIDELEELTSPLWGYSAKNEGWFHAIECVEQNI